MNKLLKSALFLAGAAFAGQAWSAACVVSDVTIEGSNADSCSGMFSGNVNSLADVNNALGTSFDTFIEGGSGIDFDTTLKTLKFADIYGDIIAIALKQNTTWAVFTFDLSDDSTGGDGFWNGTWSTAGMQWDGNTRTDGCQGCGGLSHGILVSHRQTEVPVPGTLGLLGLGLAGLGVVRRRKDA